MAKTTDLTKLEHMYVNGPLHFYYDTDKDGRRVLRHIRFHHHGFEVPADGVTIDGYPEEVQARLDKINERTRKRAVADALAATKSHRVA